MDRWAEDVGVPAGRGRSALFCLSAAIFGGAGFGMIIASLYLYNENKKQFSRCSHVGATENGCPSGEGVYKCLLSSLPYWLTLGGAIATGIAFLVSLPEWDLPSLRSCLNSTCLAIQLGMVVATGVLAYRVLHRKDPIMFPKLSNRGGYCCCNKNSKTMDKHLLRYLTILSGMLFSILTFVRCGARQETDVSQPSPPDTPVNASEFAAVTRPDNSFSYAPKPWSAVPPAPVASSSFNTMYGSNAQATGPVTRY